MKKIISLIFAATALFAFVSVAKAQDAPYTDVNGFCYSKTISKPDANTGVYTITLESFVKGSVTIQNDYKPADIVLVLDLSQSMRQSYNGSTRLAALQTALSDFVEVIYHNDNYKDKTNDNPRKDEQGNRTTLGNRISIVTFAGPQNSTAITQTRSQLTNVTNADFSKNTSMLDYVLAQTTTSIDNEQHYGTYADEGLNLANLELERTLDEEPEREGKASRTVVLFTDGAPGEGPGWTNSSVSTATRAIGYAYITKHNYSATVFTVLMGDYPSGNNGTQMRNYLQYVSSNYPDATTISNNGGNHASDDYAKEAGQDLSGVFTEIANASGGSEMDLTDATVADVDVVSASFTLPKDFTGMSEEAIQEWADANIKLYTAKYNGNQDSEGYLQFDEKKAKGADGVATYRKREKVNGSMTFVGDPIRVDAGLRVRISASSTAVSAAGKRDVIEVDGFDYANNFCGPDDLQTPAYNGHKVIIEIPIKMDPTAVGGPDVKTNGSNSGIYVNGANIVPFAVSPQVSLPVNIHIRKEGLQEGESAKFKIQRKYVHDEDAPDGDNSWKDVTSVFVTRHMNQAKDGANAPITKVIGMPATDKNDKEYVYQIVEESWSWSYTSQALTPTTSDKLETNPFIFSNQKKDNIDVKVRNAESKVTNTFKTDEGTKNVEYDDSKNNGRKRIGE